jgi:phage gp36-like protein
MAGVIVLVLTTRGSGYTAAPTVGFTGGGGGSGAAATAVVVGSVVSSIVITNPGTGYTQVPSVTFSGGGGGSGAAAVARIGTAYSTSSDLASHIPDARLAELTAESGINVDPDVLLSVLVDTAAEMDSYLGVRYSIPVVGDATTAASLRIHSNRLAKWIMLGRRLIVSAYEEAKEDRKATLKYLTDVRDGNGTLPGVPAGAPRGAFLADASNISGSFGSNLGGPTFTTDDGL